MLMRLAVLVYLPLLSGASTDATTPLHDAVEKNDIGVVRTLLQGGADAKAANRYGVTPLSLACTGGDAELVELLLSAGADPNTILPGGETVLMTASRSGNVQVVRALLRRGAQVDAKEARRSQTALMWAAAEGHVEVVEALLAAGASLQTRLDSGFTPFLFAVREGQLGVVRAMVKAGANVNETIELPQTAGRKFNQIGKAPRPGTSALHLAVGNAHYELAGYLLDEGADPNASAPGYTALHTLSSVRKPGLGDNDPAPRGSGNVSSLEFVKKYAAKGGNLNARMTKKIGFGLTSLNTNGATTYLLAARAGDAELMRALVALGADPSIPTVDNATALIVAAGLGTRSPGEDAGTESEVVEAVQAALDHDADINAVDNNGETAMHGAAYKNLPAVVELLAAKGADVRVWNKPNSHGWTPLTIAEGHRFGNYKPSPETVAAFKKVMLAAGITPVSAPKPTEAGKNSDYAPPAKVR